MVVARKCDRKQRRNSSGRRRRLSHTRNRILRRRNSRTEILSRSIMMITGAAAANRQYVKQTGGARTRMASGRLAAAQTISAGSARTNHTDSPVPPQE